jgi:hypothetical protein
MGETKKDRDHHIKFYKILSTVYIAILIIAISVLFIVDTISEEVRDCVGI